METSCAAPAGLGVCSQAPCPWRRHPVEKRPVFKLGCNIEQIYYIITWELLCSLTFSFLYTYWVLGWTLADISIYLCVICHYVTLATLLTENTPSVVLSAGVVYGARWCYSFCLRLLQFRLSDETDGLWGVVGSGLELGDHGQSSSILAILSTDEAHGDRKKTGAWSWFCF